VKKRDCRSLNPDVLSFVASTEKFFHDAPDAGLGRVVRYGQNDGLAMLQDIVFVGRASGLDQSRDKSGKDFRLKIDEINSWLLFFSHESSN
jgi:hypothetical protein